MASQSRSYWASWRMFIVLATFISVCLHAVMRNIIGITMICMVNATAVVFNEGLFNETLEESLDRKAAQNITSRTDECKPSDLVKDEYHHGYFTWTSQQQSYIFAANSWGQLLTYVPAGIYADRYSSWRLLLISTLLGGLCTFLLPIVGHFGLAWVFFLRLMIGMVTGMAWPCINTIIARWIPATEISLTYALVTGGRQISIVVLMPLSAYFCKQLHLFGGWPFTYYLTGACTLLWAIFWFLFVTDFPDQHKLILRDEVDFINEGKRRIDKEARKRLKVPYKKIIFSSACVACTLSSISLNWGIQCLIFYLPMYFRDVLFMDLYSNGESSALPFLTQFTLKMFFCRVSDVIRANKWLPHVYVMKFFNTLACFGMAIFMFGATFLDCSHPVVAVVMICLATGCLSGTGAGSLTSQLVIAPRFTGTLTSWVNFVSSFSQLIVPYMVAAIVIESTVEEWRLMFSIGSIIQIISGIYFLFFGSADEQNWAVPPSAEPTSTEMLKTSTKDHIDENEATIVPTPLSAPVTGTDQPIFTFKPKHPSTSQIFSALSELSIRKCASDLLLKKCPSDLSHIDLDEVNEIENTLG